MQLARSRIWTRVAMSISYDGNHYTAGTYTELAELEQNSLEYKGF